MFWNSSKNFGILEFPRKFQNSKIPKFFGRCFGILGKTLESWNFLGNSKKKLWNFGISSKIPKFQNSKVFFWNFLGNSKIPKCFFLEFPREFQNSKVFLNFLGNSKIPIFFLEFQNIFQKTLEFWNFGLEFWNFLGNSKIPKVFFWEFPREFQNSKVFLNFLANSQIPKHRWVDGQKTFRCGCLEKAKNTKNLKNPWFLIHFYIIYIKNSCFSSVFA